MRILKRSQLVAIALLTTAVANTLAAEIPATVLAALKRAAIPTSAVAMRVQDVAGSQPLLSVNKLGDADPLKSISPPAISKDPVKL